jgi:phosphatidylglycerophosphatase A
MRTLITFIATGAYAGYVPFVPGTVGSIVGVMLGLLLIPVWNRSPAAFLMLFTVVFTAACRIAGAAEKLAGEHDSSTIVIDEIFGMIAAMFLIPAGWLWLLTAFALFRILDVVKPWPASFFDRMHGGAGVMLDDLISGIYANLVLQLVRRLI